MNEQAETARQSEQEQERGAIDPEVIRIKDFAYAAESSYNGYRQYDGHPEGDIRPVPDKPASFCMFQGYSKVTVILGAGWFDP